MQVYECVEKFLKKSVIRSEEETDRRKYQLPVFCFSAGYKEDKMKSLGLDIDDYAKVWIIKAHSFPDSSMLYAILFFRRANG